MSDAYWTVTDDRVEPASFPPVVAAKRPRTEPDVPSGPEMPGHHSHNDDVQGVHHAIRPTDPIEASYDRYLQTGQTSSYAGGESARSMSNGVTRHPNDGPRVKGNVGSEPIAAKSWTIGFGGGRSQVPLPPEASSTLFVEGLPANCTRREVSHIFRPFAGYKDARLVIKESRHSGGNPFVLCFVDFVSPAYAATAMDTLQGYNLDDHDRDSPILRLQFARRPGARSGGWHRGRH
ncbi:hypothetical protein FXO38_01792 [Capsicum annuum]|uniref:RNA-binding protein 2 n=1 Tax=Capsicum annuum TaxID=4072 RepID=UPI0007BEDF76|nr:RNA-binding protein 2 [Capsicum annuum]KAF3681301.1 hypothetical protein FXO38_01792 [Capsicum annuum]